MTSLFCWHIPSYRNTQEDHDNDYGTYPYSALLQGQQQQYHLFAQRVGDVQLQRFPHHLQASHLSRYVQFLSGVSQALSDQFENQQPL